MQIDLVDMISRPTSDPIFPINPATLETGDLGWQSRCPPEKRVECEKEKNRGVGGGGGGGGGGGECV